jgi:cardiolipin synthase
METGEFLHPQEANTNATPEAPEGATGGLRPRRNRRVRPVATALAAFALVAFGVLLHRISDIGRGAPVRSVVAESPVPPPSDPAFGDLVATESDAPLVDGNRVEILVDETVFPRMFTDITDARRTVTVFLYFCEPGALGDAFAAALGSAAMRGVRVRLLGDGYGCGKYLKQVTPGLRDAGASVAWLRPVHWYAMHRAQHRNHGRSVVVDGAVAYTGGFGMSDKWTSRPEGGAWRDTNVRLAGPVVARLESAFLASWAEATGTLVTGGALLDIGSAAAGASRAGVLVSRPGLGPTQAERWLALSIAGARETLYIANSYFVPTHEILALLVDAARRGVDVRILLPGPINDIPSTKWAGQSYFGNLLEAGVRLFEYQPTMMHAKTTVVDGAWVGVGSVNLDNRSLRLNEEWALIAQDDSLGAVMDSIFLADLERSRERTMAMHRARPLTDRLKELAVRLVAPLL